MNSTDSIFEKKRKEIFSKKANEALEKLDTEAWLLPPVPPSKELKLTPHTEAAGYNIIGSFEAAVCLSLSEKEETAWKVLDKALDYQDMDPTSFTYGNFFWHSDWKKVKDPNAVAFISHQVAYLMKHKSQDMPDSLREKAVKSLELSGIALNANSSTWGYTNIALLIMASKLMIADVLNDRRLRDIVYWDWEEWSNHTARLGMIPEFNSPAYTMVQIHSLAMLLSCNVKPEMHREVLSALRHLITATMIEYHPKILRVTGAQSRSYVNNRRFRFRSGLDTLLYFVNEYPVTANGLRPWYGIPVGPDDILPEAGNLSTLPRTTYAYCQGYSRTNYLADQYSLGSVSGHKPQAGCQVPFFIAYSSESDRCSVVFFDSPYSAYAHYSTQHEGSIIAGSVFFYSDSKIASQNWASRLSSLNTGTPYSLINDPDFSPGYELELGFADKIVLYDSKTEKIPTIDGRLSEPSIFLETESIFLGIRFLSFYPESIQLKLENDDGELLLHVRSKKDDVIINDHEKAAMAGFFLQIKSKDEISSIGEMIDLFKNIETHVNKKSDRWYLGTSEIDGKTLEVEAKIKPSIMYQTENFKVTGNSWGQSLTNM